MMNDLIEKLSNLRSQFNCFDENERDAYHTLSEAIKVISERPESCEDTVSRQAAIDALLEEVRLVDGYYVENDEVIDKDDAIEAIRLLPSVTPKRKTGKWIEEQRGIKVTLYKCSECGRTVMDDTGYDVAKDFPFCHCGAKMDGRE